MCVDCKTCTALMAPGNKVNFLLYAHMHLVMWGFVTLEFRCHVWRRPGGLQEDFHHVWQGGIYFSWWHYWPLGRWWNGVNQGAGRCSAFIRWMYNCTMYILYQISARQNILNILIVLFSGSNPDQEELDDMIDVRQFCLYWTCIFVDCAWEMFPGCRCWWFWFCRLLRVCRLDDQGITIVFCHLFSIFLVVGLFWKMISPEI